MIQIFVHLRICAFAHLRICAFVHLCVCVSVHSCICAFVHLCMCNTPKCIVILCDKTQLQLLSRLQLVSKLVCICIHATFKIVAGWHLALGICIWHLWHLYQRIMLTALVIGVLSSSNAGISGLSTTSQRQADTETLSMSRHQILLDLFLNGWDEV